MSRIRGIHYKTNHQKKADKLFNSILNRSFKAGATITNNLYRAQNLTNIHSSSQASASPKGCGVGLIAFIVCIIITFIIVNNSDFNFFTELLVTIGISGLVAFIVTLIATIATPKQNNKKSPFLSISTPLSEEQKQQIKKIVQLILDNNNFEDIENIFGEKEIDKIVLKNSFDEVVEYFLLDDLLSEEEENKLIAFKEYFNFSQDDLNEKGSYEKVVLASILRSITEGVIPDSFKIIEGTIPFNLNRNEKIIWIFQNVDYYEDTIKRTYQGDSNGISMRISKGLYYRMGSFKGQTIETKVLKYVGKGFLGFTDKNIYFYSYDKSFRIPYSKIVTVLPYERGIRIQKEGVSAKPQIFNNINEWFAYNLIMNLSKW
ncbi:Uncharacterised protein [Capnocytophaga ochracea]|jgi:hypothetical protein|uniref:Uncharacterized protein n=1 Tax=Capnocytophaga ochracea TaxID=1018 RepID=A0A2X2RPX3_CAPOC|nr:hypothetical protein [Capnocytophaga ochracea]SQA78551.1 Uncharacterised protein [Capnocytophaga ochracea]